MYQYTCTVCTELWSSPSTTMTTTTLSRKHTMRIRADSPSNHTEQNKPEVHTATSNAEHKDITKRQKLHYIVHQEPSWQADKKAQLFHQYIIGNPELAFRNIFVLEGWPITFLSGAWRCNMLNQPIAALPLYSHTANSTNQSHPI